MTPLGSGQERWMAAQTARAQSEFGLTVGVFGLFAFSLLLIVGPMA